MSPIRSRLALVVLVSAACSSRSPSVAPATGHDIPAEHRDAFIEGAKSGAQSTSILCNPSRLPDRVELLRVRMIDGAPRPLIRSQKGRVAVARRGGGRRSPADRLSGRS